MDSCRPEDPATVSTGPSAQPPDPAHAAQAGMAADAAGPPAPQRGSRGRYEILAEHGRGALGRVSRARDRELGREVAIKELLSPGHAREARFLREVQITARLEHPGIVPIHEVGRWADGTPFYAMKLVAGRSLEDLLAERETVEARITLLHHIIAVADAIAYAHRRNIVHRDLKPGNIIVGEFGETVVIDWGLAKDLSAAEEAALGGEPVGPHRDETLTVAGTVVGTPAYMAPEQERGEPVDERADVFAIGVMLWEICAARRWAPQEQRARHRILRKAGIDRDLVTIIDKALEPERARRYRDAGELAADLKAFKSGARIAARHYSLLAVLAHWTRQHRTLAIAATALAVVAVIVGLVYVRNIAAARDRADAAQDGARRAQIAAEAALDELTLRHAQTLLAMDPTGALDLLSGYRGGDLDRSAQIRAEAVGRGVALTRATPHAEHVLWAGSTGDGAILSLGLDGTIARTSLDEHSTVVARNGARKVGWAYDPGRQLLAYACNPSDVCLFDTARAAPAPAPALREVNVASVALSPDGALLAVLSRDATLTLVDITDLAHAVIRSTRPAQNGTVIKFIDGANIAIATPSAVVVVPLAGEPETFAVPDGLAWDARPEAHLLAVGTASGDGFLLEARPLRAVAHAELCRGEVASLRFLPGQFAVAYACRSGAVGIWSTERGVEPRAQLENRADRIATDPTGNYLLAGGGNGTIAVIDLVTGLVASYRGHGYRLTALTPPTTGHPFVISGDVRGAVRVWPLPTRLARVAATSPLRYYTMVFDRSSGAITATTWRPELSVIDPSGERRLVTPHETENVYLEQAAGGGTFAAFSLNDRVELWSSATMTQLRTIHTGHGSLSELRFVGEGEQFITAGHDGRLVRWTPSGGATELARVRQPIDRFAAVSPDSIVFSTLDGALWRTGAPGPVALRGPGVRIHRMLAVPDPPRVYVGDANGDIVELDAASWQSRTVLHGSGSIQLMSAARDGKTIAIATTDGTVYVGTRDPFADRSAALTWRTWATRARAIAVASDDLVIATNSDGTIWLYAPVEHRWLCIPSGTVDLARIAVDPGGRSAVTVDMEGRMFRIDLAAAHQAMARGDSPAHLGQDSQPHGVSPHETNQEHVP